MYSADAIKKSIKLTQKLLSLVPEIPKGELDSLREVLRFHEHRYYIMNDPLISDFEYDQLYKALEKIEKDNPTLITPELTHSTGCDRADQGFSKGISYGSDAIARNSYNAEDLMDWDRKAKELDRAVKDRILC